MHHQSLTNFWRCIFLWQKRTNIKKYVLEFKLVNAICYTVTYLKNNKRKCLWKRNLFYILQGKIFFKRIAYFVELYYNNVVRQQKRCRYNNRHLFLAGAIRIELISLVLETKAQPLYQTPKQRVYYITKKMICQLFFDIVLWKLFKLKKIFSEG